MTCLYFVVDRNRGPYHRCTKWLLINMDILKIFPCILKHKILKFNDISGQYSANVFTDAAIDKIKNRGKDPFFMYLNYMNVHSPYQVSHHSEFPY